MKVRKLYKIILYVTFLVFLIIGWNIKYEIYLKYLVYRVSSSEIGGVWLGCYEDAEKIGPHVIDSSKTLYLDSSLNIRVRRLAAIALIAGDKKLAEEIFVSFLDSDDEDTVYSAINSLNIANSTIGFDKIVKYEDNPDKRINSAIVGYLNNFSNSNSIMKKRSATILKRMAINSPHSDVRSIAVSYLKVYYGIEINQERRNGKENRNAAGFIN
jgi:HEAT repeat protein